MNTANDISSFPSSELQQHNYRTAAKSVGCLADAVESFDAGRHAVNDAATVVEASNLSTESQDKSCDYPNHITTTIQPVREDSDETVPTTVTASSSSANAKEASLPTSLSSVSTSGSNSRTPPETSKPKSKANSKCSKGSSRRSKSSRSSGSSSQHSSPRIVYGPKAIEQLPTELARLDLCSPVIVSSPSRVPLSRRVQSLISHLDSRILDSAVVQVPTKIIDEAVARISGRDCVISVGGNSAVGLARAIGVRKRIPHICIPSTYSGAEPALLGGSHSDKKYGNNKESRGLISLIIYDEELTMSSPQRFSASSVEGFHDILMQDAVYDTCPNKSTGDNTQWSYLQLPGV